MDNASIGDESKVRTGCYLSMEIKEVHKQYKIHPLTLTNWIQSTPRSITQTDPGGAPSFESVARVTGVGGNSVQTQR